MKSNIKYIIIAGAMAFLTGACSTSQQAVQNSAASNDDVYDSNVEARKITYTPRTSNNYPQQGENQDNNSYYDEEYNSRLDIDNRTPYSWRDAYYDNYLTYDPFYYDPFFMGSWYRPGISVGIGWNSWGWNNWYLGWNNWGWYDPFYYGWNSWGWNPWAYNPWYSPYRYNYWGMYSVYNPVYWGGGYYGGRWGVRENNPRPSRGVSSVRPDRSGAGTVSGRNDRASTGSRIPLPTTTTTRPSRSDGNVTPQSTTRPSSTGSQGSSNRPARTGSTPQQRPTRTESAPQQRPQRTESSRPERYSPPPSSSGGNYGGGGGGRSSSGSSGGGGSRPSR